MSKKYEQKINKLKTKRGYFKHNTPILDNLNQNIPEAFYFELNCLKKEGIIREIRTKLKRDESGFVSIEYDDIDEPLLEALFNKYNVVFALKTTKKPI